ncbi:carbohydrate-binding protein [Streptomyces sp. NPDC004542]|uniref:CBM35 domain-containing protein n=1 Tax=Streptomyces sp. NPDC004542 TaxID=3154281 RepID=UPI0033A9281B
MSPGENGPSTPEDDDPFGYLYADGQARGAQPPSGGGYGYPNSVSRVRAVGERTYGGQQAQYGQAAPQQGGYGQPNAAAYQAPETFPGGAPTTQQPMPGGGSGGGRGRGPNTKGLLIGAVAVVAAVVVGIGIAMLNGNSDEDKKAGDETSAAPTQSQSTKPSPSSSGSGNSADLPTTDAKALRLDGGATTASDVEGAKADGGFYVSGFNQTGASLTWNVSDIPAAGKYTLFVTYGVPGKDANATLTVNDKAQNRPLNLANFAHGPEGDYKKGWTNTYADITLDKGTNTVKISCEQGNQCDVNFDQLWLKPGWK